MRVGDKRDEGGKGSRRGWERWEDRASYDNVMNKNWGRKGVMEVKTEESERRDRMVDLPII